LIIDKQENFDKLKHKIINFYFIFTIKKQLQANLRHAVEPGKQVALQAQDFIAKGSSFSRSIFKIKFITNIYRLRKNTILKSKKKTSITPKLVYKWFNLFSNYFFGIMKSRKNHIFNTLLKSKF